MAKTRWASDWRVGVRVWIERNGEAVLGEGRAELLAAIAQEQSITRAAKAAGMSYRRAWNLIQQMNAAAGEPLVSASTGGQTGGGAKLTARGRLAVEVYDRVRSSLVDSASGALRSALEPVGVSTRVVHLAAAISLQEAIGQILAEFSLAEPTIQVRAIFGASNELADHLLAGAPGDLYIAAEQSELKRLKAARLLAPRSRRLIATNGLTIVGAKHSKPLRTPDALLKRGVARIAIAVPACPLGGYSKRYLVSAGMYDALLPRVVHVDNSRAVLAAIVSGAADYGLAFTSDAQRRGDWRSLLAIPDSEAVARYEAALIQRDNSSKDAKLLLRFLTSPTAARCLRRCGLAPVVAPRPAIVD